jgi:hypothetical protein
MLVSKKEAGIAGEVDEEAGVLETERESEEGEGESTIVVKGSEEEEGMVL